MGSKSSHGPGFSNVWPIVQRELREGARRPINHRLRFCSVGLATLLFWILVANQDTSGVLMGGRLLGGLHTLLLGLIFIVMPAITADCIAREKRDGTLSLLFLTPLGASDIIIGKAAVLVLRAFTLWLSMLPLLAIPFLAGGITWFDALSALSLEFCAAVLCITAGLLASTLSRERNTAFFLAFLLGAAFLLLFSEVFMIVLILGYRGFAELKSTGWLNITMTGMGVCCGGLGEFPIWSSLRTMSPGIGRVWMGLCLTSLPVVILIFLVVNRFAAARLERSWRDKLPSARRESLIRRYCTPFWRHRFRRSMQHSLDRNPIAWLQHYSWKSRLSKWCLCLFFLIIMTATRDISNDDRNSVVQILIVILAGFYTFIGVNGFLEEKRSGALELLLVTPLSANQIIFGRTWGLWKQFLPASVTLAGCYAATQWEHYYENGRDLDMQMEFIVVCGFFVLPVFASYFALRVKNLLAGAALTWVALALPPLFALAFIGGFMNAYPLGITCALIFISNGLFALLACLLLRHSLSRKIYSF